MRVCLCAVVVVALVIGVVVVVVAVAVFAVDGLLEGVLLLLAMLLVLTMERRSLATLCEALVDDEALNE